MFTFQPIADGAAGVSEIVAHLNTLREYYGRLPAVRMAAIDIIRGAGDHDQAAQISALAAFVRQAVIYVCDPVNMEYVQTPDRMLLDIIANGRTYGDCDDHALLFSALAESIGIPSVIEPVVTGGNGDVPDHVVVCAYLEAGPLQFDLIQK